MNNGHLEIEIRARSVRGDRLTGTVAGKLDPGYGQTAVMLGESALSLAEDPLTSKGGVQTPAVSMGMTLVERLKTRRDDVRSELRCSRRRRSGTVQAPIILRALTSLALASLLGGCVAGNWVAAKSALASEAQVAAALGEEALPDNGFNPLTLPAESRPPGACAPAAPSGSISR